MGRQSHRRSKGGELGAGDCAWSLEIAKRVKQVFAVDVSEQITAGVQRPDNLTVVICDGCTIPLPANTVDMVYSNSSSSTSIPTTWCNSSGVSAASSGRTVPICV